MGVLLLTDSDSLAEEVTRLLAGEGFTDLKISGLKPRADVYEMPPPQVVLVEVLDSPEASIALTRTLRDRFGPVFVPFVALVTGQRGVLVRAFEAGFEDVLLFPSDQDQLAPRVRLAARFKRQTDELMASNQRLMELSSRDELTGLYNRRYFFECLAIEFERAIRYQQPLSCIMIDVDQFKPINDNFGHLVGDALFKKAAGLFRSIPRRVDVVARYGGDEVAVLLPATRLEPAMVVAERLCQTMANNRFNISGRDIDMTVSVGVATMDPENPISPDEIIRRADLALYAAKRSGRNKVRSWSQELTAENPRHARHEHNATPTEEGS